MIENKMRLIFVKNFYLSKIIWQLKITGNLSNVRERPLLIEHVCISTSNIINTHLTHSKQQRVEKLNISSLNSFSSGLKFIYDGWNFVHDRLHYFDCNSI